MLIAISVIRFRNENDDINLYKKELKDAINLLVDLDKKLLLDTTAL